MQALGLTVDDYPPPEVDLWPENAGPVGLFSRIATQWRTGASGVVGLDYLVVFHELDRLKLDRTTYDDYMASIRVIEDKAMRLMHED